jgi:radical SAM superfamily enzyme YgiQ (UPF0313 family)
MRILFVYPDINIKGGARSYNYGIGVISAFLRKHGHETDLFYMYPEYDARGLSEKIIAFEPHIVAFAATSPQFGHVERALNEIPLEKGIFTICGGPHVSCVPESLEAIPRLDAICIGEGEHPLLELADGLKKGEDIGAIRNLWVKVDGQIRRNPCRPFIQDLDGLPFSDREIFDYQSIIDSDFDTAFFMFSRGCPFDCTYCANHALKRLAEDKYTRLRSVDSAIEEIREVVGKYRVRAIFVCNEVFGLNKQWAFEFCDKYRESGIGLPFDVNTRVETLTEELCGKLKEAGCRRVNMGIESGNPFIRNEVLNRKMTNEQIIEAFRTAKRAGLKTKSFNIVGFPHETKEHFQDTIRINQIINPDTVILAIFDPYPGTRLYEECEEKNLFRRWQDEEGFIPRTDTMLELPSFPRREIRACYRNFAFHVYKKHSLLKAVLYRVYYSNYGEWLIRALAPLKKIVRRLAMGI